MGQKCLNCGAPIYQPFEPCIDCGMRPTDPALRRQMGKAEYEREQGHHRHALSIKNRSRAAQGLQKDLLHEVPMLYGQNNLWGADIAIGKIHWKEWSGKAVVDCRRVYPLLPKQNCRCRTWCSFSGGSTSSFGPGRSIRFARRTMINLPSASEFPAR